MRLALVVVATLFTGLCKGDKDSYNGCLARPENAGENGAVNFVEAAISAKHSCRELRRNDCLFYHEATEKCKCCCQELVTSGRDHLGDLGASKQANPQANPNNNPYPYRRNDGCFHGDDMVITNTQRGTMKMSELIGKNEIQVLTYCSSQKSFEFAPIQYWTHAGEKTETAFYIYSTESGHNISITPLHLIYETDCRGRKQTILAKKVQIGNCLLVNENGKLIESKVISRKSEKKVGVYAPITSTGSIVVNDILASCYTNMENETIQKMMYTFIIAIRCVLSYVLPSSWMEIIFSAPFESAVSVPSFLYSFIDLAKGFIRMN